MAPLRVEDAEEMALVLDDPQLHRYTGGQPNTFEQLRARYRRQVRGQSVDGSQLWFNWVLRHRQSGIAIGYVQVTVGAEQGAPVADLAWVVASAYQGRGYARQAAEAVVGWLRDLGADRITAHIRPDHRASMAVATGIGMTPTDTVVKGEVRWTYSHADTAVPASLAHESGIEASGGC